MCGTFTESKVIRVRNRRALTGPRENTRSFEHQQYQTLTPCSLSNILVDYNLWWSSSAPRQGRGEGATRTRPRGRGRIPKNICVQKFAPGKDPKSARPEKFVLALRALLLALLIVLAASLDASANPLLLPVATTSQVPLVLAYAALNVLGLSAGASYLDPTTGVKVYKLTSATFPTSSASGFYHDYAEGGHEISLPHTGHTRSILVRNRADFSYSLIDFTPGVGVSNARALTGNAAPTSDIHWTFSNNPATPHYAYVCHFNTIYRIDILTGAQADQPGVWPVTDEDPSIPDSGGFPIWIQQAVNDSFFVWMLGANGNIVVGYDPATATRKARTITGGNDPHVDRAGRYISVTMTSPANGLTVWDWQTDTVAWTRPGDPGRPFAHYAALSRRMMGVEFNGVAGTYGSYWYADPSVVNSDTPLNAGGRAPGIPEHVSGNWEQPSVPANDQWALANFYGALQPTTTGQLVGVALGPGGMQFATINGQRRLLGHSYNSESVDITALAYAKPSPDGKYVLFTSNMNGTGRFDLFLAELPVAVLPPNAPTNLRITA